MHRLPAQVKLVAMLAFVVAVVAIPREAFWAHFLAATMLAGVILLAAIPSRTVLRRMTVEIPFVIFALLLPFLGGGERITVSGVALSVEGLWGAWTILAKATLGVAASIVFSATTPVPEMLRGMERIRVPAVITAVTGFMVRYLDIVASEFTRRRVAMASRGYQPRWFWETGPMARSAGTLFIRSFERGERLHRAMVARGFTGRMPEFGGRPATFAEWAGGLAVPAGVALLALIAVVL